MPQIPKQLRSIDEAGEILFQYAINREDVKTVMAMVPELDSLHRVSVEYEIPLLKIVGIGWAVSYFMEGRPERQPLMADYWRRIEVFSQNLSEVTSMTAGSDINYFQIIRERMDAYLDALHGQPVSRDPVATIGPAFARLCGSEDNIHVIVVGNHTFGGVMAGVRSFLASVLFMASDTIQ